MPEESTNFPITGGYSAISEMARSLARTLQAAPAQESRRAAALRTYLIAIAEALAQAADLWGHETGADASDRYRNCHALIRDIRRAAAELTYTPPIVPPGINIVFQAFAKRWLPQMLVMLRSTNKAIFCSEEYLESIHYLMEQIQLVPTHREVEVPHRFLVLRYPQGEQDNVLLACQLMGEFCCGLAEATEETWDRVGWDGFATQILGPAYYFALQRSAQILEEDERIEARLHYIWHRLKAEGWLHHSYLGELLARDAARYSIEPVDPELVDEEEGSVWRRLSRQVFKRVPHYTSEDFDRDVPRLWERLRQLLPPNDLDINAVESVQPADEVSILNAGWSFYLLHMDDLYHILGSKTAEDRYEAKQVLNRLLTKGIELSQIARRWKEAREEA